MSNQSTPKMPKLREEPAPPPLEPNEAKDRAIFIRNNTLCIFSYSYNCGILCAYGETAVYIKDNGVWSKWLVISEWES